MNKLVAYKCKQCGRITYPRRFRCLNCHGREFEEVPVAGKCKLLTFSEVRTLPWGIDERERVLGVVEFQEGFQAMGWIKAEKPNIGMKLHARWEHVRTIDGEAVYGFVLEPA